MNNLPIGVFDSGVGGLTVAKEIMNELPNENIIYFGDTARVPYGDKSRETVTSYSRQIVEFLMGKEVKCIVVACNTASAYALETVRHEVDIPMIGVVKPGARTAASATRNGRIGVIGTEATVRSHLYNEYLKKLSPDVSVFGKACPLLCPLVEEGWIDDPVTEEILRRYLKELIEKDIDTLVLGCTHYPILKNAVAKVTGEKIRLVNPALETARELKKLLEEKDLLSSGTVPVKHCFYVSDGADKFRDFANSILPCEIIETKDVNIKKF